MGDASEITTASYDKACTYVRYVPRCKSWSKRALLSSTAAYEVTFQGAPARTCSVCDKSATRMQGMRTTCPMDTRTARLYHGSQQSELRRMALTPMAEAVRIMLPRLAASEIPSSASRRSGVACFFLFLGLFSRYWCSSHSSVRLVGTTPHAKHPRDTVNPAAALSASSEPTMTRNGGGGFVVFEVFLLSLSRCCVRMARSTSLRKQTGSSSSRLGLTKMDFNGIRSSSSSSEASEYCWIRSRTVSVPSAMNRRSPLFCCCCGLLQLLMIDFSTYRSCKSKYGLSHSSTFDRQLPPLASASTTAAAAAALLLSPLGRLIAWTSCAVTQVAK